MKSALIKKLAIVTAVTGIVIGCDNVINHVADQANQGSASTGTAVIASGDSAATSFASIDSGFSDSSVSPGGTGGVIDPTTNDVGEETRSFFEAFQIDPASEDTAGPKFVIAADLDKDGDLDLISGWNQSQPVQIHRQSRDADGNVSFTTANIAGTMPIAVIAGIQVGQINDDNGDGKIDDDDWLDIVILAKATGYLAMCPTDPPSVISSSEGEIIILFNPRNANDIMDGDSWEAMNLVNPFVTVPDPDDPSVRFAWPHNQFPGIEETGFEDAKTAPEWNGFTDLVVANIDGVDGDDIVVALNPGVCKQLGQEPPTNTVDLWTNPGPGLARAHELWGAPAPAGLGLSRNVPIAILTGGAQVKDIEAFDVDGDGDLDIVASYTNEISRNLRWARNPLFTLASTEPPNYAALIGGTTDGWRYFATNWEERPIGQVDTSADKFVIGDIDGDGFQDILVRSNQSQVVQWFRHPNAAREIEPVFPPPDVLPDRPIEGGLDQLPEGRFNFPWPVFTLTEFETQEPEGLAIGDLTGDGRPEIVVAAEGAVFWYSPVDSVFDAWAPNTIIQDSPTAENNDVDAGTGGAEPVAGAGVGVAANDRSTHINALLIVDLDGDGRNDIIGTLDRRSGAGVSDDRLVWYRNTRTLDAAP